MIGRTLAILGAAFLSTSLALAAEPGSAFKNENLLNPIIPDTDVWEARVKTLSGFRSMAWLKNGETNDMYVVSLIDPGVSLEEFREIQDSPGREQCEEFTSTTIDESPVNGYEHASWQTMCRGANGNSSSILSKVIVGNDKLYHVQRVWRYEPAEEDSSEWREHFIEIAVCDSRLEAHPCPEGFERVESE